MLHFRVVLNFCSGQLNSGRARQVKFAHS
ncbi:hypothetical protein JMJ77_0012837 [Colletotrichum scovillei]|uniref:Uncharacterized protein n=1 Tax=Colletotrichum scovillei TaxID=1209932 RepID=A0A9P7R4J4_9PEZI|nr:hypothetical protein JMJ77_0012837 [Colletotrichum scovillei]KAG7069120.1 hypothetical protein JMJ76_0002796 [Colletotrichum scovillei]KAG7073072.1 hypothetical protein JMJ78_0014053 [Colletotrichum scovillei]